MVIKAYANLLLFVLTVTIPSTSVPEQDAIINQTMRGKIGKDKVIHQMPQQQYNVESVAATLPANEAPAFMPNRFRHKWGVITLNE
jgi:hypothetical protein